MDAPESIITTRQATMTGLAVVGFVALVASGIWLAVYSTRYVPDVVGRVGSAAVFLGSVFTPAEGPSLSVVPTLTESTTIPFSEASSTISTIAHSTVSKPATVTPSPPSTVGVRTNTTYQMSGATTTNAQTGLPDLVVSIKAIGYLGGASTDSFIASSTVPSGLRPAITFIIKNVGTRATGLWRFSASIPTQTSFVYQSELQQSLNTGDSIEYTLGFDQAIGGTDKMVSIAANPERTVIESNTNNNDASATITIIGG
ncbi:MAG: hypothetical protein AAB850_00795 [Patescibacteria group bacterium]|mgnify:CR=1 FL=1